MELITVSIKIFGVQASQGEQHFCTTVNGESQQFCIKWCIRHPLIIVKYAILFFSPYNGSKFKMEISKLLVSVLHFKNLINQCERGDYLPEVILSLMANTCCIYHKCNTFILFHIFWWILIHFNLKGIGHYCNSTLFCNSIFIIFATF